jgi:hypothetical protein
MKIARDLVRRFSVLSCLLVPAFWAAGCGLQRDLDSNDEFSLGIQQNDIPVPLNFQFDKDQSFAFIKYDRTAVGSFRSWVGFYYGDQQIGNLIPWYQKQMTADGWAYRDQKEEGDKRCLRYSKGDEMASIWLYRDFDHRSNRYHTVVRAEVHPTPLEELAPEEAVAFTAALPPSSMAFGLAAGGLSSRAAALPATARAGRGSGMARTASALPSAARPGEKGSPISGQAGDDAVGQAMEADLEALRSGGPGAAPRKSQVAPAPRSLQGQAIKGRAAQARSKEPAEIMPAPQAAKTPPSPNKPVVSEEVGAENNEELPAGDELTPDDEGK